jgi:hypothetical protein
LRRANSFDRGSTGSGELAAISKPYPNPFPIQKLLHIAYRKVSKMENARSKNRIGLAFEKHFRHVF